MPLCSRLLAISTLGGALILCAQSPHRAAPKTSGGPNHARTLVEEEARAVQRIDRFEVSHQVDITSVTPHYNQTMHAYVKTWVERPNRVRAESRQFTRRDIVVSDGATTWIYNGASRTYRKIAAGAPPALFSNAFPGLARQLSSATLPSVMTAAKLAGTESLKIAGRSYPCDIVEVTVTPSASEGKLLNNTLRMWISREYKVPLKVEAAFAGSTPQHDRKYSDFVTDFEPNLRIPPSTWKFVPPDGAKQTP